MKNADKFVIITNIQFEKHEGWQQRHKIPGPNGDIWLTVPVLGSQNQLIKDVKVNNQINWRKKHKKTLEAVYAKSKGREFLVALTNIYDSQWQRLADLNVEATLKVKEILGIRTPVVIDEKISGHKHQLLINICKKYNADTYLSGVGVKLYLDEEKMKELENNKIIHRIVKKNLTARYPYSTVHYLLSEGKDWVLNVI
ncbi:WbqC family protein [Candidatus Curtissbacteria bacterium]|nr:WbqC family protein [Candidatus Curtissbacteria bacterium]